MERSTRFVMLVALPHGHKADLRADALAAKITTLPAALTRTLTWDQGHEMAEHVRFTEATGVEVYFCDPQSPWQRESNENTYWYKMAGLEAPSTGVALARAAG